MLVTALLLAGCGGDDDATSSTTAPPATAATTADTGGTTPADTPATTTAALEPSALGDEIGALYLAAYDDVVAALDDRPEPAIATERLTALKEDYIEQLVALGREREALAETDRATVDAAISQAVMSLPEGTLTQYQEALDHYFGVQDNEVYDLAYSFNIIGQYANFDLLREQEPDEAARLGVD